MTRRSRITPGDGDPRHGTVNGYNNLHCRCTDCRVAAAGYYWERVVRSGTLPPDDPRHGTSNAYHYWRCSCAVCRAAHAAYQRDSVRRRKAAGA